MSISDEKIKIKICGITDIEDARLAVELGADYLGLIFCRSPRRLTTSQACRLIAELPGGIARVGVFMDQPLEEVKEIDRCCRLDYLQFHGRETPEFYRGFGPRAIKAVRVATTLDLEGLDRWETDLVVLDSSVGGRSGGTGMSFPWEWVRGVGNGSPRIILGGGLNPYNVAMAIERSQPYAVDVSSGVEARPGKKDPYKLSAFINAVRQAEKRCA
ncbi:MAG: phosphoribosylanthranilate isomerase [Firmicutes bacterium]|nr:phosphoribosylanthranilate isomerase [Bacillota bacterium]